MTPDPSGVPLIKKTTRKKENGTAQHPLAISQRLWSSLHRAHSGGLLHHRDLVLVQHADLLLVSSISTVKTVVELTIKGVAYGILYVAKGLYITLKMIAAFVYDTVQRIRRYIRRASKMTSARTADHMRHKPRLQGGQDVKGH